MVRDIRVSATSFSGIRDSGSTEEKIKKNREAALEQLKRNALDIVCLPETFTLCILGEIVGFGI